MTDVQIPQSIPKAVAPFVARARELSGRDPVMSYWCKFKAAQLAMAQIPGDQDGRAYLENLMDELEDSKASLADNELVTDDAAGSAYVFNFASRVFDSADKADRDEKATRTTAKEFLAASVFFEILSIFGALETDVAEKVKYAKWKATSIAKAFREGRQPTPGPAQAAKPDIYENGEAAGSSEEVAKQLLHSHNQDPLLQDQPQASTAPEDDYDFSSVSTTLPSAPPDTFDPPSPTLPSAPPEAPATRPIAPSSPPSSLLPSNKPAITAHVPSKAMPQPSAPRLPPPAPVPAPSVDDWQPEPTTVDPVSIGNAQKHAKWAISALNYEDVETARKELRLALQLLGGRE